MSLYSQGENGDVTCARVRNPTIFLRPVVILFSSPFYKPTADDGLGSKGQVALVPFHQSSNSAESNYVKRILWPIVAINIIINNVRTGLQLAICFEMSDVAKDVIVLLNGFMFKDWFCFCF